MARAVLYPGLAPWANVMPPLRGSGQVLLAKHFAGDRWQSLTIPRNESEAFNQTMQSGDGTER